MSIAQKLRKLLGSGVHRIGELELQSDVYGFPYALCHYLDSDLCTEPAFGGLEVHQEVSAARELSTHGANNEYRFTKGQTNLKRGWVMVFENEEDLRLALDHFYPAALGLFLARQEGVLEVEDLRDKLDRQTGMYIGAKGISDAGAQKLVTEICGPAHQCAKKILWQIDPETPLDESPASLFNGIVGDLPETEAIPLLCREACNHFVAECRKEAKAERLAAKAEP